MDAKQQLSAGFRSALERWGEESLEGIGIFRDKFPDFEKWKEKSIEQLRSVYSDKTIDVFLTTKDNRTIDSPDGFARFTGSCGDTMEIFLRGKNGIIMDSSFQTDGCISAQAAGGMVIEMLKGKRIDEIKELTPQDVLDALGGLPKENEHCATLAIDTLKRALDDLITRKQANREEQRSRS